MTRAVNRRSNSTGRKRKRRSHEGASREARERSGAGKGDQWRFDEVLRRFPGGCAAAAREGSHDGGAGRGFLFTQTRIGLPRARRSGRDASGSVDAITGEGLSLAFQQAVALADAIERRDLMSDPVKHRRIGLASGFHGSPAARHGRLHLAPPRAMRAMASKPWIPGWPFAALDPVRSSELIKTRHQSSCAL